eukprot:1917260-Pleurochrysis_carterae.AAC.2
MARAPRRWRAARARRRSRSRFRRATPAASTRCEAQRELARALGVQGGKEGAGCSEQATASVHEPKENLGRRWKTD